MLNNKKLVVQARQFVGNQLYGIPDDKKVWGYLNKLTDNQKKGIALKGTYEIEGVITDIERMLRGDEITPIRRHNIEVAIAKFGWEIKNIPNKYPGAIARMRSKGFL